jgi:hypothetical protein
MYATSLIWVPHTYNLAADLVNSPALMTAARHVFLKIHAEAMNPAPYLAFPLFLSGAAASLRSFSLARRSSPLPCPTLRLTPQHTTLPINRQCIAIYLSGSCAVSNYQLFSLLLWPHICSISHRRHICHTLCCVCPHSSVRFNYAPWAHHGPAHTDMRSILPVADPACCPLHPGCLCWGSRPSCSSWVSSHSC